MAAEELKRCFVISPIGDEGSDVRRRSDQVLRHVIEEVVQPLGYEAIRADKISQPGIITSQVIQHLLDDDLVIADLTDHNPSVFYELAIRHMVKKPIIQMIQIGQTIPFDVASNRTIRFDYRDLDSVHQSKAELKSQIEALKANPTDFDNPISITVDLQSLKQSPDSANQALAAVVDSLQGVTNRLNQLEFDLRLGYPVLTASGYPTRVVPGVGLSHTRP